MILVGKLVEGKFVCMKCPIKWKDGGDRTIPVHDMNMESFSQRCSRCREKVVHGSSNLEMFPIDADESQFHWVDMQQLLVKFDTAFTDEDFEYVGGIRKEMYERILRAIIVNTLHDRERVFSALQRVMETQTRWQ